MKKQLFLACAFLCTVTLGSCSSGSSNEGPPPITVEGAIAKEQDVPVTLRRTGVLEPNRTYSIVPQVSGALVGIHFQDGEHVEKGKLLYSIDPREYQADVASAQADVAESRASLAYAESKLKRYSELIGKDYVSPLEIDEYRYDVESAQGALDAAEAALELAYINLEYCKIYAPYSGVMGEAMVSVGNYVTTDTAEPLTTLNQIDPILAYFYLPEKYLSKVLEYQKKGGVKVQLVMEGDTETYEGDLSFVNNTVNLDIGAVEMYGTVPNPDGKLWPGRMARMTVVLETEPNQVTVPTAAVLFGGKGPYVIVEKDGKAENRSVTLGEKNPEYYVIKKGVKEGEKVVTVGQLNLWPGRPVNVKTDANKS